MKSIITILLLTITVLQTFTVQAKNKKTKPKNYIDSISTAEQIESLVRRAKKVYDDDDFKVDTRLESYERKCKDLAGSLAVKPWTKADFDNNGLTDLVVVGNRFPKVFFILDKGDSHYEVKYIWRSGFSGCILPRVIAEGGISKVMLYWATQNELNKQMMVYKFGDFIEENPQPVNHHIEKIEYSATGCYGPCPIFDLTINVDKSAVWHAERFNEINSKEVKGTFKARIDDVRYNEIVGLLNYCDFEKLKGNYSVNWTDDESVKLKVTYDDGKTIDINDYGHRVPFGLKRLYKLFADLRENQNWVE